MAYFKEVMEESKSKDISEREKHKKDKRRMQNHKSFK